MIVQRSGDWIAARVGDELVMMSAERGQYVGLTGVGARIWELVDSPQPIESICERLVDEFDVAPDVCRADVLEFLEDLAKQGAIAMNAPSAA
jgi:hypothetical protein